jgi:hypothetical protein
VTDQGAKVEARPAGDFDRRDAVGLAGVFLLGLGFAFVYPPLGAIVPGAVLTAIAVFGVRG